MTNHKIHVISLPEATDRAHSFVYQFLMQDAAFESHDGVVVGNIPFAGVNMAHKKVVQYAKDNGLEMVTIAEDDIVFSAVGAWEYYIEKMPESFDVYFGMVYSGNIVCGRVFDYLAGLTLYTVHSRFYDKYLALPVMNHIDRLLGTLANENEFYVCDPFVCEQSDGWSFHKKEEGKYKHLVEDRKFFGR